MKIKNALWIAAVLLSSHTALADNQLKTVTVEAEAPFEGDVQATENEAKRQARRAAIEQGAGVLVESNSIVRNYELLADEVVTSAKGVIVEEQWGPLQDSTAHSKKIKLTAKVSPQAISDSICTVIKANHDPKVAIVFVEKFGDSDKWTTERGLVEAVFTEAFMNNCFTIVESGVKVTEVSANGDLPQATINEIVKNANAQYVVLGQGKFLQVKGAENSTLGSSMKSYSMSASLKLMNTSTNEYEATTTAAIQVLGISPENALKAGDAKIDSKFTGAVMNDIMQKVSKRWTSDMVNAGRVVVIIKGVPNYGAAKAFAELVKKTFGIDRGVEQRSLSGGDATFDITLEGGADKLAEGIEGKKAGKFTVEVTEVTRGKVILTLK